MSEITGIEMPINKIKPFVIANVKNQCIHEMTARMSIVGSPGCGKSDIMRQICEENGWGLAVKYMSNMDLCQITGIPCQVKDGEEAKWTKPEIFNFSNLDYKPNNYKEGETITILFIDDFHLCDRVCQKYMFQLLTYKSINGYHLPKNTAIILAGNRNTDKALANTIPAPIMNRLSVFEVTAESSDWLKNFAFKHGVRDDITSFIHTKGDIFLSQSPIESVPWASPRSWTFLSEQMNSYEKNIGPLNIDTLRIIATGLIGSEYTAEFIAYRELFSKWNFDDLSSYPISDLKEMFEREAATNSSAIYAITNAVSSWMINKLKVNRFDLSKKESETVIDFTYEVMTTLLSLKVNNIQVKPLVIAGTNYIYMFQEAVIDQVEDLPPDFNFNSIIVKYLQNLKKERDIDYIYFEILINLFGKNIKISDEDKARIAEAKRNLKM